MEKKSYIFWLRKMFLLILILESFLLIYKVNNYVLFIFFINSILLYIILISSNKYKTCLILFIYIFIIQNLQFVISLYYPKLFLGYGKNLFLFKSSSLRVEFQFTIFIFLMSFLIGLLIYKLKNHKFIYLIENDFIIKFYGNPVIYLFFIFLFEYFIRSKYIIAIPGEKPLIKFAGYIHYIINGVKLYFFSSSILYSFEIDNKISKYIYLLISIIFVSLASILLGWRGAFLIYFIITFVFLFLVRNQDFNIIYILIAFIPIITLSIFLGNVNRSSIDQTKAINLFLGIFLNRITGLSSVVPVLNFNFKNNFLGGWILIKNVFGLNTGITSNQFYTFDILGYPKGIQHSSATPLFSSLYIYGGILFVIIGTVLFAYIILLLEENIKFSPYEYKVLFVYIYIQMFLVVLQEGNFESILKIMIGFSVPYIFLCLISEFNLLNNLNLNKNLMNDSNTTYV